MRASLRMVRPRLSRGQCPRVAARITRPGRPQAKLVSPFSAGGGDCGATPESRSVARRNTRSRPAAHRRFAGSTGWWRACAVCVPTGAPPTFPATGKGPPALAPGLPADRARAGGGAVPLRLGLPTARCRWSPAASSSRFRACRAPPCCWCRRSRARPTRRAWPRCWTGCCSPARAPTWRRGAAASGTIFGAGRTTSPPASSTGTKWRWRGAAGWRRPPARGA